MSPQSSQSPEKTLGESSLDPLQKIRHTQTRRVHHDEDWFTLRRRACSVLSVDADGPRFRPGRWQQPARLLVHRASPPVGSSTELHSPDHRPLETPTQYLLMIVVGFNTVWLCQ